MDGNGNVDDLYLDLEEFSRNIQESDQYENFYRLSVSATIRTDIFVEAEDQYEAERKVKQGNFEGHFEAPDNLRVNSVFDGYFEGMLPTN